MFLAARLRLIAYQELFRGSVTETAVSAREVMRAALRHHAAAVAPIHNHPSGDPSPSLADECLTRRLQQAPALIEVDIRDHLIVGESILSFAEEGLL